MNQEVLEILIGKHLDGEITPGEQRILDVELERDPRATELLAELRNLHERSSELVASCILGRGAAPREIIEQAWEQAKHPIRHRIKRIGYVGVAVGVAAGFVMGLAVQFVLLGVWIPENNPAASGEAFVRNVSGPIELEEPGLPELVSDPAGEAIRNVDWYHFTDKQGNHWLIEGLHESTVRPAAYEADL